MDLWLFYFHVTNWSFFLPKEPKEGRFFYKKNAYDCKPLTFLAKISLLDVSLQFQVLEVGYLLIYLLNPN